MAVPWRTRYIGGMKLSSPSRDRLEAQRQRLRAIPVRSLLPNMITLLALCVGLTGIRLAFEGKLEMALAAIVFAAALDGIDGRLARLMKGQSKFGAELDSLADFMNFGCAPALFLYLWGSSIMTLNRASRSAAQIANTMAAIQPTLPSSYNPQR